MSFTINSPYMLKLKLKHSMINWDDEISQKQVDCLRWGTSTKKPRDGQNLTTKLQMAGLEAQLKQLEVSLNHGKLTFTSDEWERFGIPQTMDSLETIGVGDFIEVSWARSLNTFPRAVVQSTHLSGGCTRNYISLGAQALSVGSSSKSCGRLGVIRLRQCSSDSNSSPCSSSPLV